MSDDLTFYKNKTVLITGHTGFKGSWLSLYLLQLGANVIGVSLDPPTPTNHFDLLGLNGQMHDIRLDIRNQESLLNVFIEHKPEIVFHLAAESLVLNSYEDPAKTFEVNVQGSVNVLEAIRKTDSVKTVIIITTDKVYNNDESNISFVESDPLGASDPYSTSKAMTELLAASYYKSFFKQNGIGLATARAGNVIGGGDFSKNRLVPDCMRALFSNAPIILRNPNSRRPWMHVLDPLRGYLLLGEQLFANPDLFSTAFNFGPKDPVPLTCQEIAENLIAYHGKGSWVDHNQQNTPHEMSTLQLNSSKAAKMLGFKPFHNIHSALQDTLLWFEHYHESKKSILDISLNSLNKGSLVYESA